MNFNPPKSILPAVTMFAFAGSAHACEPILPFVKVVGGPGLLLESGTALLAAVVLKSTIFAFSQKRLSYLHALLLMIAGNIVTTVIGFLVAVLIGSGPLMIPAALIVWPLCYVAAKRLIVAANNPWLKEFSAWALSLLMTTALVLSCILFALTRGFAESDHLTAYWIWKLVAVYIALIVSIVLTAFWEEWVVWKFSRCPVEYSGYAQPVIRANLVILLCVMLFAAGAVLPQRFKSRDFLVKLGLVTKISPSQSL